MASMSRRRLFTGAAAVVVAASTMPEAVAAPAATADGFAGVNALGQNGTTGGVGGPVVTASTAEQFLDYIDTVGPLTIQLQGRVDITIKQGVRPDKTIVGLGTAAVINGGGLDFYRSYNVIVRNTSPRMFRHSCALEPVWAESDRAGLTWPDLSGCSS